jgi:hypothetical protein
MKRYHQTVMTSADSELIDDAIDTALEIMSRGGYSGLGHGAISVRLVSVSVAVDGRIAYVTVIAEDDK